MLKYLGMKCIVFNGLEIHIYTGTEVKYSKDRQLLNQRWVYRVKCVQFSLLFENTHDKTETAHPHNITVCLP